MYRLARILERILPKEDLCVKGLSPCRRSVSVTTAATVEDSGDGDIMGAVRCRLCGLAVDGLLGIVNCGSLANGSGLTLARGVEGSVNCTSDVAEFALKTSGLFAKAGESSNSPVIATSPSNACQGLGPGRGSFGGDSLGTSC